MSRLNRGISAKRYGVLGCRNEAEWELHEIRVVENATEMKHLQSTPLAFPFYNHHDTSWDRATELVSHALSTCQYNVDDVRRINDASVSLIQPRDTETCRLNCGRFHLHC